MDIGSICMKLWPIEKKTKKKTTNNNVQNTTLKSKNRTQGTPLQL